MIALFVYIVLLSNIDYSFCKFNTAVLLSNIKRKKIPIPEVKFQEIMQQLEMMAKEQGYQLKQTFSQGYKSSGT